MNILVTSIGRRVQLIEHLKGAFTVFGADASPHNSARYFTDGFFVIPRCDDEAYVEELVKICKDNDIKMIIPLYEGEFVKLCDNAVLFADNGISILLSDREIIDICNNKMITQQFFEQNGISAPAITTHAPAVVKPVCGMGSRGIYVVDTDRELEAAKTLSRDAVIVQERVTGDEYTIDVLCDFDGQVAVAVPRLREEVRSGEVAKSRVVNNKDIIRETIGLIEQLNKYGKVIGPITVQCFLSEDGKISFIEINPRFGGGVPLTFESGVDYAHMIKGFMEGKKAENYNCQFQEISMMRYDQAIYEKVDNDK